MWAAPSSRGNYKRVVLPVNSMVLDAMQADAPQQGSMTPEPANQDGDLVLTVEWPETIFVGETGEVRLFLDIGQNPGSPPAREVEGEGAVDAPIDVSSFFEDNDVVGEARLDLSGPDLFPQGTISENLILGKRTKFAWSVLASQTGTYKGTIWFYLNIIPRSKGEIDHRTILARQVEIEARDIFGFQPEVVRGAGFFGILMSIVLAALFYYPNLFVFEKK